ncbi:MAG: hypothetical protein ACI83B_002886 [Sediminicola sp.]|jgi:hypothetical protein|tara:strand:+ start:1149 stop:2357 length:1209 start_codon:yes stop_codon:yes gene_type:complete
MNPSAANWIPKFLNRFKKQELINEFKDEKFFYDRLKSIGFIYGVSVFAVQNEPVSHLTLTKEEFTKINLFHALLFTFFSKNPTASFDDAFKAIVNFYDNIGKGKTGFFQKFTLSQSPINNLEQILAARLYEANNLFQKSPASLVTYALLYSDVLAFRGFLISPENLKQHIDELETTIISCSFLALTSKEKKNKDDIHLLELFKSSSEYLYEKSSSGQIFTIEGIQYLSQKSILEKRYLLDLCILAIHDDHEVDASEYVFVKELSAVLGFSLDDLDESIESLRKFSALHSEKIQLFKYSNPVNQFYRQSTKTVKNLILRNKSRLGKELDESSELLILLGQSTIRDLNAEEKTKVKEQLLDICKTIPSLTIFLLPGGTLLLPLLVKFIPKLLPSSFQDNRIDKK